MLAPIRDAKPSRVFLALDGPREGRDGEAERCRATLEAFRQGLDWDCEVSELVRTSNLGCRRAVSGAISWALDHVNECIIVEDDCVIQPSFFGFCQVLLDRHRDDTTIMGVTACNFQQGKIRGQGDYYASKYSHCWGWATWRRAWVKYEDDMAQLAYTCLAPSKSLHQSEDEADYWKIIYQRCVDGEVDSWAYRWLFSCWKHGGLTLIPNVNLVSNRGFGEAGTHTTVGDSMLGESGEIAGAVAPSLLEADAEADAFTFRTVFCPPLTNLERQILRDRIKVLKAEVKQLKHELKASKAAGAKRSGLWGRLLGR